MITTSIETRTIKALMMFAAKRPDVRPYLKALHIEQSAKGTIAVASNGHAIAVASIDRDAHEPAQITIDRRYIDGLKSTYAVSFGQVDSGTVTLGVDGTSLTVPVLEAKFPDWRRVISVEQTDERAYFDPEYAVLVNKAGQTIRSKKLPYIIRQNGGSVGYCNLDNVIHAYVAPLRAYHIDVVVVSPVF